MRLPPFQPEWLELTNIDLGKLILGLYIAANADENGISPNDISETYAAKILQSIRTLPDDHASANNDSILLSIRLASHGKFESAGKKFREHFKSQANFIAAMDMISRMDADTATGAKVRRSAKLGHAATYGTPAQREMKRLEYLEHLDDLRKRHPSFSAHKIHKLAEKESLARFGNSVGYKTYERAEKDSSSSS